VPSRRAMGVDGESTGLLQCNIADSLPRCCGRRESASDRPGPELRFSIGGSCAQARAVDLIQRKAAALSKPGRRLARTPTSRKLLASDSCMAHSRGMQRAALVGMASQEPGFGGTHRDAAVPQGDHAARYRRRSRVHSCDRSGPAGRCAGPVCPSYASARRAIENRHSTRDGTSAKVRFSRLPCIAEVRDLPVCRLKPPSRRRPFTGPSALPCSYL
jgi:hypothetical protein